MDKVEDHAVVIIGAGPSGLALAIELGSRGVSCLLVERNERVGYAPRAKTTNVRTRTHLRRWGIADKLAAAAPFGIDYPATVSFVTRLGGFGLARIENHSNISPERNELYPEHGQWIPQYTLEQVMREHAEALPSVTILFNTEFASATQDADGLAVTLRDARSGDEQEVGCRYLVGADGARSAVRDLIGATLQGQYGLSRNYNIVFRAPGLAEAHPHGRSVMYWQVNPVSPSLIGPMDKDDVWFFMPTRLPEGFRITPESAATLIRESTGIDLPYEIMSSDEWVASSFIADKYRDRRVFLVGDACHLHPPFGGFGMNMGVADGADLGWKIAATLEGWGGPLLLDSYEAERRGIHEEVIAAAAANHSVLSNDFWTDGLEDPGEEGQRLRAVAGDKIVAAKKREFHTLGTVLGGCYADSPVIANEDAGGRPPQDNGVYTPSSFPGCLAPHLWRADGRSLYDLFGPGFTLVHTPAADAADLRRAVEDARGLGAPLTLLEVSSEEAGGRYPTPLTLVRPDQFVAWRGRHWTPDIIDRVAGWDAGALARPVVEQARQVA